MGFGAGVRCRGLVLGSVPGPCPAAGVGQGRLSGARGRLVQSLKQCLTWGQTPPSHVGLEVVGCRVNEQGAAALSASETSGCR